MSTILERIQYGYDRDSRRTWRRRALATGEDYHYGYDGLSQVVSSNRGNLNLNCSAIAATPRHVERWDYDPTGNWHGYKVEEDGSVTLEQYRHHDKGNRLTLIEGEPSLNSLDRPGRMTQAVPGAYGDWDAPLKFTWDAWNRVTEIRRVSDDAVFGVYSYDGLSRRVTREVYGVVHHAYYSDTWKPLEERMASGTTASVQYLWGSRHRDDLVRRDRDSDEGGTLDETRYVLMDYYSPAAITDEAGSVTERYNFTAFGMRRIMEPNFSHRYASECEFEFAFQGQFLDFQTNLLNFGYRYYSPRLGRWLCKDPIEESGGLNLYVSAFNDNINAVDFFGLEVPPEYPIGPVPDGILNDPDFNKVGRDMIDSAVEKTVKSDKRQGGGYFGVEYCGLICYQCTSSGFRYSATGPIEGTPGNCNPWKEDGKCGEGWEVAGTYHSHPDSKPPSPDDRGTANKWKLPGFVGGPEGNNFRYDPGQTRPNGPSKPPIPLP